jgi:DNA mismatch repair ATPase MutS
VTQFVQDVDLGDSVTTLLKRSHDSQRLAQKFVLNRGDPDELLRLASTIQATSDIVGLLEDALASARNAEHGQGSECFATMVARISLEQPLKLARRIRDAIDEDALVQQHRIEDSETGAMLAAVQGIVKAEIDAEAEGSSDLVDGDSHVPGLSLPPKTAVSALASTADGPVTATTTKTAKKRPASIRDHYGEDNEIWVMKQGASTVLRRLHKDLAALRQEKDALAESLRERLGASSLTLRWTPGLGHICHVRGKDARTANQNQDGTDVSPASIRTLTSSRTTRSFHHAEWTALGQRLDRARLQIRGEEARVFSALRIQLVACLVKLRRNAAVLDELDIATSFARLAIEQRLTRPILKDTSASSTAANNLNNGSGNNGNNNNNNSTLIIAGRHPTVENGLASQGRTFDPNDSFVGSPGHGRAWLITGPNMAGKSTFLRQVALTTVLAQVGSYVPAAHAELGVVDALFTRVGSADDLYRDQSTFMVEMLETAAILREATPRSLVVMDEIGRGTTPEDGVAVAFATLHHLVHVNRCRALFATHFHTVADLAARHGMLLEHGGEFGQVEMYCTDVEEDGRGGFVYIHKLRKGINRQSHALKVARLAGLPEQAMQIARQILANPVIGESEGANSYMGTTAPNAVDCAS